MENSDGLLREIHKGLLKWYDFSPKANILYVGLSEDDLAEVFMEQGAKITFASSENEIASFLPQREGFFHYIVVVGIFETFQDVNGAFHNFSRLLHPEGILLIGANNRLGLRFWCGERELYTGAVLEGISGYAGGVPRQGRMYSRYELKTMLRAAAFDKVRFFAVLPNLDYPMMIYREDFVPREDLANRLFPLYKSPDTLYLKEEALSDSIASEGVLPALANAYIIECSHRGDLQDVLQVTSSAERGKDNALLTIVRENVVEKRAFNSAGIKRLQTLEANIRELKERGIRTVEGELKQDKYFIPYVTAETGQKYLKRLLFADKEKFVEEMDAFREMILNSSEHMNVCGDEAEGIVLRRGYIDMVPLNSFRVGNNFVVFDQEFCQDNCPANFIITRMIFSFYAGNDNLNDIIPLDFFLKRYKLEKNLPCWLKMADDFIVSLRNMKALEEYTKRHRRDDACVSVNRARMNIPQCIYDKHVRTMLDKAAERKLILFGSGRFARNFMARFGHEYSVYAIVDNNERRHGEEVDGIKIYSPQILRDLSVAEYKIIICVKDYEPIAEQLEKQGIFFYGIYNPRLNYSFPHLCRIDNNVAMAKKKYHIGYIAGVFDLFHIGHLNMFRRAKEQCHYLIVGVVSDRQVREGKKVEPFVPFEERMEMVKSCRYVDEVRAIPYDHPDTDMAWKLYHFDVQFSGSDYEHDPVWLKKKEWLEERGSTMVFFPYTQSTSSTRLKKLIEERLI